MDTTYNPQMLEKHWYTASETRGDFVPKTTGQPYSIVLPPPNVTGTLHMGHAFQVTLMDVLCRYHRMQGEAVLWQGGVDHAGIATQMVVSRQLQAQGIASETLDRDTFLKHIWAWKEQSGGTILQQLRRLGASIDWGAERFTLDPAFNTAVIEVFVKLHAQGLIYRGKRLVNWDPVLQTALSDLEVLHQEEECQLWHIHYPLAEGEEGVTVATTRPETLFGDVAVAVHPEDERYRTWIGRMVCLPLTDRQIPIIADEAVDPTFGSGCVKITPGHDFNDYAMAERHGLAALSILGKDARVVAPAPEAYIGLDRFEARKQVLAVLSEQGKLLRTESHQAAIPRGDRSGSIVEPYLTDQWYVKMAPLAVPAQEAVRKGQVRFVPEHWEKTYHQWLDNLQDWCISRQLWWGHRIPAWYDSEGNVYVARTEAEARQQYALRDTPLTQDPDVLDTWFSAALWPFVTQGWPERTERLQRFYPTSVLVTGFDILFFWVARMITMGLYCTGDVPFREVYITGLIRDHEGQKMSKSKGNVLDPLDLVEGISLEALLEKRTKNLMQTHLIPKIHQATTREFPKGIPPYGTDALRMTLCALANMNRDIRFDAGRLEGYRNFCNKLWNAARYVLMNCPEDAPIAPLPDGTSALAERYIHSALQGLIEKVHQHIAEYRFDWLAQALYEFVWYEYCDWYVEWSKGALYDPATSPEALAATRYSLLAVLETVLRLLHPIIPFITEEIWHTVAPRLGLAGESLGLQFYPMALPEGRDLKAEADAGWIKQSVTTLRALRSQLNLPPGQALTVSVLLPTEQDAALLDRYQPVLMQLSKLHSIHRLNAGEAPPVSAMGLAGEIEWHLPFTKETLDVPRECQRVQKALEKTQSALSRAASKLENPGFLKAAQPLVIEQEKAKLAELQVAETQLKAQLAQLMRLSASAS